MSMDGEGKQKQNSRSTDLILYRLDLLQKQNDQIVRRLESMPRINDVESIRREKDEAHSIITAKIVALESQLATLESWRDSLVNRIALSAVVGLVLMVLALYGLDKFFRV